VAPVTKKAKFYDIVTGKMILAPSFLHSNAEKQMKKKELKRELEKNFR
jgi:hypothetical protein